MKYLILGAGPAGLTFANKLKQMGENDFLVLEKEGEAGGLCRTVKVDGFPFDIGGGHFLDICRPAVLKFLFDFMPEKEWCQYNRDSRICINGESDRSKYLADGNRKPDRVYKVYCCCWMQSGEGDANKLFRVDLLEIWSKDSRGLHDSI